METTSLDSLLQENAEDVVGEEAIPLSEHDLDVELIVRISDAIGRIDSSVGNLHVALHSLMKRVDNVEKFVSYLIAKDEKALEVINKMSSETSEGQQG